MKIEIKEEIKCTQKLIIFFGCNFNLDGSFSSSCSLVVFSILIFLLLKIGLEEQQKNYFCECKWVEKVIINVNMNRRNAVVRRWMRFFEFLLAFCTIHDKMHMKINLWLSLPNCRTFSSWFCFERWIISFI